SRTLGLRMRRLLLATLLGILLGGVAGAGERTQPLLLMLRGRDSPALDRWLAHSHRRPLDPAAFGRRFGASPETVARATRWLEARGLAVRRVYAGRTLIEFDGPPDAVAAAFQVRLGRAHGRWRSARPTVAPLDGTGQRISIPAIGQADAAGVANFRNAFGLPPGTIESVVAGDDPG